MRTLVAKFTIVFYYFSMCDDLGPAPAASGMVYQSAGVPMQYVQQAPMPTLAHPVIQYNGKGPFK